MSGWGACNQALFWSFRNSKILFAVLSALVETCERNIWCFEVCANNLRTCYESVMGVHGPIHVPSVSQICSRNGFALLYGICYYEHGFFKFNCQEETFMYVKRKYSVVEENPKLWRYMSYSKFQNLMETSSVYFCRLDKFDDQLEGTQPQGSLKFALATENPWQMYERCYMDAVLNMLRNVMFVNCWHINDSENPFMWKNYATCHGNEGVAIQTDLNAVKRAFAKASRKISDMRITYVDFKTYDIDYFMQDPFKFVMLKDKQFLPENELRFVTVEDEYPDVDENDVCSVGKKQYSDHEGELIKVDLEELINRIYLAPNSTERFARLILETVAARGLNVEVVKSAL